ncbi:MAG TPA: histidine kinase [Microlunatus sp.]|nr:histidine kinase [Microlunatus sp.]
MVLRDLPGRLGLLIPRGTLRHRLLQVADVALLVVAAIVDLVLWGFHPEVRGSSARVPVPIVLVSTVVVFAVLLVRRRRPWLAYAAAWVYAMAWSLILPLYQPFTALLIGLYAVGRRRPTRPAVLALIGVAPVIAVATYNTATANPTGDVGVLVPALVWCVLYGMVWTTARLGWAADRAAEMREAKRAAEAALAVADERLRLARELHDIVAHSVTGIVLQAAGVRRNPRIGEDQLRGSLELIERTGTQAMRELRRLLGLLRQPEGERPGASLAELDQLVELTEACQIAVRVQESGQRRGLTPELDHVAFRVVQESLANVIKHGGRGSSVDVDLAWEPDQLRITVTDQPGEGPADNLPTEHSGLGLRGLTERLQAAGGELVAGPEGVGFRVAARLPG